MDIKLTDFKLLFSTIRAPPIAKLAIISSDSNIIPTWLALSCFFLSQCQILSLIIKTALFCASSTSLHLTQTLSIVHKVLSVGDALDFNSWPVFSYAALTVVYVYLTSILFFLVFLMRTLHSDKLHVRLIQRVWNIVSYAHTLLFFYPIHTITLKTITLAFAEDQKTLFNTNQARIFIQVYSCISFALNIFFAAITIMFLYPPIQTKFALSSKTKIMVIISIGHKLLLPLLWIISFPSNALKIFLLILNLIICLIRDGLFFRMLPYYNINALRIASTLFAPLTLLSLASLISKLASQNESFHESLIIMFASWVLVTPFTMKIYQSYLRTICHRILFQTSRLSNPYYLIHYWPLYKNLTQERAELKIKSKKLSRNFLYYLEFLDKAANRSLELNQREEDKAWSRLVLQKKDSNVVFESSQCVLSLFIVLLRLSTRKNPMMILPKLWLAFSRLKYEKSFLMANQAIQEAIEVSPSINKTISFGLLWLKMLRKLKSSQANNASEDENNATGANSNLNMQDFLHVKQRFHKLKDDIKGQLTTQTRFWKEFQNHVPEYDSLMNLVKLTQGKIRTIQKSVKDAHSLTRPNFYESILILGLYLCFIQNDYEQGQKFLREYDRLSIKERINYLATGPAHKRNSEKKSLYFVLSANSKDMGKIVSHSKNISQLLRIQTESAVGKHINIFAAKAENRPGYVLGVSLQDPRSFEGPSEIRLLDARGYLLLCSMTITLNFLPKTGLSICVLLKPTEDTNKGILINNHGAILQCSEDMENELELGFQAKKEVPNMFLLCPHLSIIIQAYKSVLREESRKVRNPQIENGFNKPSEGSVSPIDDGNEDEIFDTEIEQDGGYQRLYQKYSKGDTLIFYPSTNKKLENVNSLTFLDYREDVPVKPVAYLATIQNCPNGKGKVFLLKLKEKISGSLNEVYASLDPALKIKGMNPELKKQLMSSSEISTKNPEKLFSTSKMTNNAVGSNLTGSNSKPSLHNIDAQLEEIKEIETEEANHEYARSSCHVPSSPEITDRYNGLTTDRYNTLLQKEYEYEDTMIKKIKPKEPSLTHLNPHVKLVKAASDNKSQEITKASKEETGSNILKSRAAIQTTSQILLTDRRPQTKEEDAHDKPSNGGSSVSSQLNRSTRPEKIIRNVLISRRRSKCTVVYASYFLCVVSSLLGFLLWFSMNASTVSNTASSVSDVLQNLYFRCYWTNLANQETRLYVGVKGNISTEFTDLAIQIDTTNMTFHKMALFNNQLRDSISKLDKDTQLMFSEKNVNAYVRNASNDLVWQGTTDTFQLVSQMLTLGFINVYTPVVDGEVYVDYINPESRFIFDNSFGDLLIVNENLITAMTDKVYSTFENSERTNISILGGAIAISVLFIMASVAYIWSLNKESYRFADVLFTLPHEDIHLVEHTLLAFQDMLDKEIEGFDCVEALDDVKIMNRARTATQKKLAERNEKVKNTQTVRQANMFNSNKRNWLLFLRLITIQLLIFGLLIFYYSWSLNRIKILKQQQVIINSALESINLQSLISVELQAMAMDNETTPIRHQPIFPSLENDVYKLSQLSQLEDSMKDTNGNLPDAQKAILIHFSCEDAYSPLYMLEDGIPQYECDQLASTGYTGLLTLLADETTQLKDYLNTYSLSSKDADTLAYLYITSVLDIMGYIDVTTTLFLLSYSTTQSDFVHSVNDLLAEGPILSGIAGAVVPLLALWSWFYVIRWLASKEFDKKEMLALVPTKMILSNRHLKHYIFRIASSKEKVHSVMR